MAALPFALMMNTIVNGLSRPMFGWLSDHIGRELVMFIAFSLEAVGILALGWYGSNPWAFVVLSGIVFFAWGEVYSLFSATAGDTFGTKNIGKIYGLLYCAKGIAALLVPFGNLLMEATGTWTSVLYTMAALDLSAALAAILILRPMRRRLRGSRRQGCGGVIDPKALAQELAAAYVNRQVIAIPPSARAPALDLPGGYAVEAELVRLRQVGGHQTVGRKVGFANKAMWRELKLDTLVWARMYDDTVRYADNNEATLPLSRFYAPKIEPEIVFKMGKPLGVGDHDEAAVLDAVEWLALGFEIIDCMYADWKFQPADFVASYGFHAGLIVGQPLRAEADVIARLCAQLPAFKVRLLKNGELAAEGSGKNALGSPALCVGELAVAITRQPGAEPLGAGELISSGALTESQFIAPGETWTAAVEGIDLPRLTVRTSP